MDTTARSAEVPAEEANYRWNFMANVIDLAFFMLGVNMVSQSTILPLLVRELTPSKFAIGAIPAIFSLAFLLPQLLSAGYTERMRRKLPFLIWVSGAFERVPYLLIGMVVWFFAESAPQATLAAIFILIAISATTGGILTPAWYDLIAKVIPVHRRGLYSGVANGLGAFMGIAGAALGGYFLGQWSFPQNYALCFAAAYGFLLVSWAGLALNREPESTTVKPPIRFFDYIKQLPALLRRDRNYQAFLVSRSVANLGGMGAGFFIVYGAERFGLDGTQAAALTGILVGSQALMNLVWGLLADRKGHKLVLACAAGSMALAALTALLAGSPEVLWLVFFLLGSSIAADSVSGLNIILEFSAPEDRPTYIGLTNTLLAPAKVLAPLIGGSLATWLGYPALFTVALLVAVTGSLLLSVWLQEPRLRNQLLLMNEPGANS